jgi:outer membrane protein OmpA-like peptidoglycan-associated protein
MFKWVNQCGLIILLLVMLSFSPKALFGQYFLYNDAPINIDASFTRHSIESSAQKTIFNVLIVKNKSNRQENLTLNITVPQGWDVVGAEKTDITLNPLDSVIVPVRIAIGAKAKGDIGYSIIASLTDAKGNTVKNVYCFVKIPRVTNLNFRYIGKLSYLDPVSNAAEFAVIVKNRGNREEPVNVFFDGNRQLLIGGQRQNLISSDLSIPPYTDSTFTFRTELKDEELFGKNMFSMKSTITTVDTTLKSTFWFRKIESSYKNYISPTDKPLTIEILGQGLLEVEQKPVVSVIIEGKTLFKGNSEIYYYYRNFESAKKSDFYDKTKMYIGGVVGNWSAEIGDNTRSFESVMFGRGAYLAFQNKFVQAEISASRETKAQIDNLGGQLSVSPKASSKFYVGFAYNKNNLTAYESRLGFAGTDFKFLNKHLISARIGYNEIKKELDGKKDHTEYGGEFDYTSVIGKVNTSIRVKYGSLLYNSPQSGRLNIFANTQWYVSPRNKLSFYYTENKNNTLTVDGTLISGKSEMLTREGKVEHMYFSNPNFYFFYGPAVENFRWLGAANFPKNTFFNSINYKLIFGLRFKSATGSATLTPKVEIARSYIINNPFDTLNLTERSFNYQFFSLNFRNNSFNILAFYTSGPRSIIEQANYAFSHRPNRRLQFMPAYDRFIYKDVLRLYAGLSYSNDIVAKSSYSNITGQVYWYMPKDWRFYLLSVYSLQSRTNPQENVETYQSLYVEASLRKEFNIQHPRVKFYDIDLVFFKDFDGNFIQGDNEPGVKNVLLTISREEADVNSNIPGDFYSTELLSDNLGKVRLEKIPEGLYKIIYNPIGKDAGNFSKALEEMTLNVDKNKILYIPFVEKNKVFGKIILSRSRLSGLSKVDVSNVRITATDSKGRTYTTLTDKMGEFVLFAPVTDQYVVNINNIFYENFDLRQNNFKVQFNGYKQFEVNFVFDEKIRRINFSPSSQDGQLANILQVRRTNLKGTIKDANNLAVIRARVSLVNTKNNTVLTTMYSSSQTGDYNISFMADDYYLLEVLADGYWYHSENLNLNQVTTFLNVTKDIMLKPISIGSKIELNIKFAINKTDLEPESVAELNRLLKLLKDNGNIKIEVQGHSDDLEALNNTQISEERAKVVARYLIENGFSNIQIRGFGNTVPVSSNDTEQGRTSNRRVEVEVVSK